ncbi:hypothetical protein IHE44_0009382 [Lamprotornis superbus]|uniref:Uncharacterized protein n=1 Tax=Lamprotornis superbus TaxID=245042 RepID=A0A835U163_9PASS|nr:hypothetical protein IHE44_0009382 [Lamprotornis superbus]
MSVVFLGRAPDNFWCRIPGAAELSERCGWTLEEERNFTVLPLQLGNESVSGECERLNVTWDTSASCASPLARYGNHSTGNLPLAPCRDNWVYEQPHSSVVSEIYLILSHKQIQTMNMIKCRHQGFRERWLALLRREGKDCVSVQQMEMEKQQPHHCSCKPEHLIGVQALAGVQMFMTGMYFQPAVDGCMDCKAGREDRTVFAICKDTVEECQEGAGSCCLSVMAAPHFCLQWQLSVKAKRKAYDLVCGNAWMLDFSQAILNLGFLAGAFILGYAADRVVPESPRWLLTRKKGEKALKIMRNIAKHNGKFLSPHYSEITISNEEVSNPSFLDLVRTPQMRRNTLILMYAWFTSALIYQGLVMRLGIIGGNLYLDFFISGAVELPAAFLIIVTIDRVGRRLPFATSNIVASIACLITAFLPEDIPWLKTTLATLGRLSITIAFEVVYLVNSELYPTTLRYSCSCLWPSSIAFTRDKGNLITRDSGGCGAASKAYPGIPSQLGKESRANGFSVYKPVPQRAFLMNENRCKKGHTGHYINLFACPLLEEEISPPQHENSIEWHPLILISNMLMLQVSIVITLARYKHNKGVLQVERYLLSLSRAMSAPRGPLNNLSTSRICTDGSDAASLCNPRYTLYAAAREDLLEMMAQALHKQSGCQKGICIYPLTAARIQYRIEKSGYENAISLIRTELESEQVGGLQPPIDDKETITEADSLFREVSMRVRLLGVPALALKPGCCCCNYSMQTSNPHIVIRKPLKVQTADKKDNKRQTGDEPDHDWNLRNNSHGAERNFFAFSDPCQSQPWPNASRRDKKPPCPSDPQPILVSISPALYSDSPATNSICSPIPVPPSHQILSDSEQFLSLLFRVTGLSCELCSGARAEGGWNIKKVGLANGMGTVPLAYSSARQPRTHLPYEKRNIPTYQLSACKHLRKQRTGPDFQNFSGGCLQGPDGYL